MSVFITERNNDPQRMSIRRTPTPKGPRPLGSTEATDKPLSKTKSAYLFFPKLNRPEDSARPMPSLREVASFSQRSRTFTNMEVSLELSKMLPKQNTFNRYLFAMDRGNCFRETDPAVESYFNKADMFEKVRSNKSLQRASKSIPLKIRQATTETAATNRSRQDLRNLISSPDKTILLKRGKEDLGATNYKPTRLKRIYTDSEYYRQKCEYAQNNFKIGKQLFLGMMSLKSGRQSWLGDSIS